MSITKISPSVVDFDDGITITVDDNSAALTIKSTDADSANGPIIDLVRDSASPADSDSLGMLRFKADNDAGEETIVANIKATVVDVSDGSEDGRLLLQTMIDGTSKNRIEITNTEVVVNQSSADSDFRVESDGKQYMLFVDGGNDVVGIGTSVPASYNANADNVVIYDSTGHTGITIAGDTDDYGNIYFAQGTSGSDAYRGYIQYGHSATSDTSYRDVMLFGTATLERMRIKSDGTVGIGDNDPSTYLTIKYNSTSQEHGITVRNLQSGGYGAAFTVKSTGDSEQIAARFLVNGENNWGDASSQDSTIYLQTLSDNSLDGRIRIYSSGYTAVKGHMTPWTDDTYDLGQSSYRWDDIYATNNTIQTSDKNLKDNITESDLGLSFIKELKPVSYKWKDKTRTHYGLIAQDVKETLDSISKSTTDFAGYIENKQYTLGDGDDPLTSDKRPIESEDKILGLRYQEFLAPLIKAVQEQQTLIETLEAKVKALEEA